jgi:predicted Ser/Thr protein kinase
MISLNSEITDLIAEGVLLPEINDQYHPVYGLEEHFKLCLRKDLIETRIAQIIERLSRHSLRHMRIFEAGSNIGYVTMKLAEIANISHGMEYNANVASFSKKIADYNKSRALIQHGDAFKFVEDIKNLEQYDVVVSLNVIHQLIFSKGLDATKEMIGRIAANVDYLFLELAYQSDYLIFEKAHLLPTDPLEILELCQNSDIEIISTHPRLFVCLRRRTISIDNIQFKIKDWRHTDTNDHNVARKIYFTEKYVIKAYRFNEMQPQSKMLNEVEITRIASKIGVTKNIIYSSSNEFIGNYVQERVYGQNVNKYLDFIRNSREVNNVIVQYIRNLGQLAKLGIYHNDISGQNVMYQNQQVYLIDFEQAGNEETVDNFFLLSWFLFDLLVGAPISYEREVYAHVSGSKDNLRQPRALYPVIDLSRLPSLLAEFVSDIFNLTDFHECISKWNKNLEMVDELVPSDFDALRSGAILLEKSEMDRQVTPQDVRSAFLELLGREPENESVVQEHIGCRTVFRLRNEIIKSQEYKNRINA